MVKLALSSDLVSYDAFVNAVSNSNDNLRAVMDSGNLTGLESRVYDVQQLLLNKDRQFVVDGCSVEFDDDIWDFTALIEPGKNPSIYKYYFNTYRRDVYIYTELQVLIMKLYIVFLIHAKGIGNGSITPNLNFVKTLFVYINKHNMISIERMTVDDYKEFIASGNHSTYSHKIKTRRKLRDFIRFYDMITGYKLYNNDFENWFKLIDTAKIKADEEHGKSKLLSSDFVVKYSDLLYQHANNDTVPKYERGLAGLLYIMINTGRRTSEICTLPCNGGLVTKKYRDHEAGYMLYQDIKSARLRGGKGITKKVQVIDKTIDMWRMLRDLFDPERDMLSCNFLVPNVRLPHNTCKSLRSDISANTLEKYNQKFCIMWAQELNLINSPDAESFNGRRVYTDIDSIKGYFSHDARCIRDLGLKYGDVLSMPMPIQFRVYYANHFQSKVKSMRFLSMNLGHQSGQMIGYYVRPKKDIQEDSTYSRELLREVIYDNLNLIGPKGKDIRQRIDNYIATKEPNVMLDLEAVVDYFYGELPIRAKAGGFCIKSNPNRTCDFDSATDEFYCAFDACPNQCSLYFDLPSTYKDCNDLLNIIDYNYENDWKVYAQKESYKLQYIIINRFEPQLKEFERILFEKGRDYVLTKHPLLEDYLDKIDHMKLEVCIWKEKIAKVTQKNFTKQV